MLVAVAITAPGVARADSNDLDLARLATRTTDANGNVTAVTPDNTAFRSLASELGVVLAPQLLTPADTIGFGGFQLTVDATTTTIDASAPYWRALEGTRDPTGTIPGAFGPSSMSTLGFFVRKGIWFPVPSFEIGAGAVHLTDSSAWTGQLYTKLAIVEGYHQLPLPSLAVRGGVSRLMTQRDLDLTVTSLDVSISKHVGVGGTWRFDPYAGYDLLAIIANSGVLDPVPNINSLAPGNQAAGALDFVFKSQDTIYRNRLYGGVKLQYYVFQLSLEAQYAFAGTSNDSVTSAKDTSKAQRTLAMSAGFDF